MISFEQVDPKEIDADMLMRIGGVNVFQTPPWLRLIADLHDAEPIMAKVKGDQGTCGYFSGLLVKKYGLRILGSPFRGWATYFMGFNLMPEVSRQEVLRAFPAFVFRQLGCHYLEIIDPCFLKEMGRGSPYHVEHLPWFALDLTPDEDGMFANMKDTGRRGVRKALKSGVSVEEASDPEFADDYYSQYKEVMAKQSLLPVYEVEVVRRLIRDLFPTGSLLLLRARNPEGLCIATALFLILNKTAIYWGGASWQEYQQLHPNELIIWQAMKTAKKRGAETLHLGGEAEQFKLKFGSHDAAIYRLKRARNIFLDTALLVFSGISENSRFRNWFIRKI
jgi:hypothetical protein